MAQSLRVALDATPLTSQMGGVRRYTAELAQALARRFPRDAFFLVSDQPFEFKTGLPNLAVSGPAESGLRRRWWSAGLALELRRLQIDVFHGTDFSVPYFPARPSVMTVHDCSPWRKESRVDTSPRVRARTPALIRLGLATMIVTPSEAVRHEVMHRFHLPGSRVAAIPLAAAPHFRPVAPAIRERPYFLYVGAIGTRKNVAVIEKAARELRVDLLSPAQDGHIPEQDLPALYCGAAAVLYPSLYEGFGLPVLEAMQCGAVVIASRDTAITELGGGAILQVDAADQHGWIEAMRSVLAGEAPADLRKRALSRAASYSWERTAVLTREVYDEARRLF